MNTVELFAGSKSFSKVRQEYGDTIFTVDIEEKFKPNLVKDILKLKIEDLPKDIDVLWLSPPCTTFSVAGYWYHFKDGKPSKEFKKGLRILDKTIKLLSEVKPRYWYLENPRGLMRKYIEDIFNKYGILRKRNTITYCQYGHDFMKPTDIWTNNNEWQPRSMCKNGDACHVSAPRCSQKGLASINGAFERSKIPSNLFTDLIKYENTNNRSR